MTMASSDLLRIRQGSRSVGQYVVHFQTIASELHWNNDALRAAFWNSLSDRLKDELVTRELPDSLEELTSLCVKVDLRMQERGGGRSRSDHSSVSGEKYQSRHKRSWMMPGTLWCGAGSTAENFTNLGLFRGVDLCCREHDHCFPQIQAFEYQYGIRNYRLHTVSHCDCDDRFRLCLQAINDAISTLVGIMFFNVLEMPCFSLREEEQCVEWHWWGGCKRNSMVPKAELQKPAIFNDTNPEGNYKFGPLPRTTSHPLKYPSLSNKLPSDTSSSPSLRNAKERRLQRKLRKAQRKFERARGGMIEESYKAEETQGTEVKGHSVLKKRTNKASKNRKSQPK
ncbi:group 3 secretory phospholipase A2 [Pseudophryne corroboree]|uniref:group 3 secretory phospholipase A2 n=1 Tax=Pseudophryne corroboree TaxID=495146 RepID=UPI003081B6F3